MSDHQPMDFKAEAARAVDLIRATVGGSFGLPNARAISLVVQLMEVARSQGRVEATQEFDPFKGKPLVMGR